MKELTSNSKDSCFSTLSTKQQQKMHRYALYYNTYFSYWTLHNDDFEERQPGELLPVHGTNYTSFVNLIQELDGYNTVTGKYNVPSSRNFAIKSYLMDLINNLRTDTLSKVCLTVHRNKDATRWVKQIPDICSMVETFKKYHNEDNENSNEKANYHDIDNDIK